MDSPYKVFKTDAKIETEGLWLDYGGFEIRIKRAGGANARYKKLLKKRVKPYRRQIDNETISEDTADRLWAGIYADSVIDGWRTKVVDKDGKLLEYKDGFIPGEDGELMQYSRENCIKLLLDLPDLFTDIKEQAQVVSNFRAEALEEDEKK
jgi:hypothetical protein